MKINPIVNYFKWIVNQLHELQKHPAQQPVIYKIAGKEFCEKAAKEMLVVQVIGKNIFLKLDPVELVTDENSLKGFSALDVRTITFLACQSVKKTKSFYRIIAQFFSKTRKEEMFTIQKENESACVTRSAQEISSDIDLIGKFNSQDAHRIGYIAGVEQGVVENEVLQENKLIGN